VASSAQQTFGSLLVDLAAQTPAPGGGSASAWTGALAAALGEMVAGLAGDPQAAARATVLRAELVAAGERELNSYAPVLDAARLPKSDPSRKQRLDAALSEASETPLAIVRAASRVAELARGIVARSSSAVAGDAVTAVLLAEASCRAAARLVEINLADHTEDPRLSAVRELAASAGAAREAALKRE
jgi:glutamate formiminotransferase/formiminotetrahydrofolate cyclodeaminase